MLQLYLSNKINVTEPNLLPVGELGRGVRDMHPYIIVHIFQSSQDTVPVNRFVGCATDGEGVVLIIDKLMGISWVLVTGLKDLARLNTYYTEETQ